MRDVDDRRGGEEHACDGQVVDLQPSRCRFDELRIQRRPFEWSSGDATNADEQLVDRCGLGYGRVRLGTANTCST